MKEAADFCADSLSEGWQQAVADRAASYAQSTLQRLFGFRRRRYCKPLAQMAREILRAKDHMHELAGDLAGNAVGVVGVKGAPLAFTRELVANIPLNPVDAKMTAAARGIQITGILLCVMTGRDVTRCQCFIDLALAESKERVGQILTAGMSDWSGLARYSSPTARAVH